MIEILSENFNANETKTFLFQGGYIEILDALYPVNVYLMDRSGGQISTMRNAEASFFSRPGPFEVIQINSPTAQTVRFFVGSGDAGTRRASGVVSVVDGGKARTLGGSSFQGVLTVGAGAAGNFSKVGLSNLAGNTKNVIVKALRMSAANVADFIFAGISAAPFATDVGGMLSKKAGGAVSAAHFTNENNTVTNPFTPVASRLDQIWCPLNQTVVYALQEPIVIPPGYTLGFHPSTAANGLTVVAEFNEEA